MIQRIQSLFLLQLLLLGFVLMYVPCARVIAGGEHTDICLLPVSNVHFHSSAGHWAAIALNFLALALGFLTLFLYNRRALQKKLCLVLCGAWLVLTLMMAFCPFIEGTDGPVDYAINYYAVIIGLLGTVGALVAARFIQRDINLLKSADRIR
jgi:hypothetical protein